MLEQSPIDRDRILGWVRQLQDDLHRLDEELARLQEERDRTQRKVHSLLQVIDLEQTGDLQRHDRLQHEASGGLDDLVLDERQRLRTPPASKSMHKYVVDHAEALLRDRGEPMHIGEIHDAFRKNNWMIPGAGKPVNLIAHLRRSDRIAATPQRGQYGLTEWEPRGEASAGKTRSSRRRRPTSA